jgi:glycosyltransferase involved in cell wall biosynthesis
MLLHAYYLRDARVLRLAECLAEAGFEVHVVSCKQSSHDTSYEIVNGVHIYRIPLIKKRGSKMRYFYEYTMMALFGTWKLTLLHLKKRFDVIHIHNMPDLLVVAGLIPKWTGSILVLDIHDPMNELFQENYRMNVSHLMIRVLKMQEFISYRLADQLFTVSIPMAENVAKKRGCMTDAVKVVHNFPDLSKFPICKDRKQWPYNKDGIVLFYSGTVTEHYRLDIAVRALAEVSKTIPNIRFQILGEGPHLPGVLNLAMTLGIDDRVEHFQPVKQEMVKDIMANADIGISTHQAGAFGDLYFSNKIIEFMTQGLPVISSRTYTIEKYIPEDTIFYFEPEQVKDLVKQILFMYNNPGIVIEKIGNSKKLLSKLNWQEEQRRFLSLYEELLNSRGEKTCK